MRTDTVVGEARTFNRAANQPIVVDDMKEVGAHAKPNTFLYKGINLPDEQLTLNVRDFTSQIATPQAKSVARGVETMVAAQMNALTSSLTLKADGTDVHNMLIEARKRPNKAGVPIEDRFFAVSAEVEAMILNDRRNKLIPAGAAFGESMTYNGFALRLVRDYDPGFQQDRSVVSTLAGADTAKDENAIKRAVRLTTAGTP